MRVLNCRSSWGVLSLTSSFSSLSSSSSLLPMLLLTLFRSPGHQVPCPNPRVTEDSAGPASVTEPVKPNVALHLNTLTFSAVQATVTTWCLTVSVPTRTAVFTGERTNFSDAVKCPSICENFQRCSGSCADVRLGWSGLTLCPLRQTHVILIIYSGLHFPTVTSHDSS